MYRFLIGCILAAFSMSVLADGNAAHGKTLVTVCQACHGPGGNSSAGTFPKLAGQNPRYLVKEMHDIKSGARQVAPMTGMLNNFSDQDMEDIAAYFASQKITPGAADPKLVNQGEAIYRAGIPRLHVAACAACHSPTGSGNDAARFPALAGQWPQYVEAQLKAFRAGTRTNDGDGKMMRTTAENLNNQEIKAVASYIYGLRK